MLHFSFRRFFFRESFAITITIVIILIAFILFLHKIIFVSVPENYESFSSDKIKASVKVYFNTFGIPSIQAQNNNDLFFAAGYVHARDRLWQMDIMRRTAYARLSEIFGKETLDLDKFFKSLSINEIVAKSFNKIDKKTLNALTAYSEGVNKFIEEHKSELPFEFQALSYLPEPWKPSDCIAVSKLVAFDMSIGFINDVCLAEISEKTGVRKALSLVTDYPDDAPCICDTKANPPRHFTRPLPAVNDSLNKIINPDSTITATVFGQIHSLIAKYSITNNAGGSNSIVVKSSKDSNSVILANDPHLKLVLPSYWYQCQMISPDFNVTGLMFPGSPFFLIGRNNKISWGITIMMIDDCDFFIERLDPENNQYYFTPNGKKKFRFRADTIYVKNEEPVYYYTRFTDRSAVISDNYIMKKPEYLLNLKDDSSSNYKFYNKFLLTFSWTGTQAGKELEALYEINRAKNWNQFTKALNNWSAPGLNWTYADKNGNMGIKPAGLIPIRDKTNPLIPNPGWMSEYSWKGFITPAQLPFIYNPSKGFVASSNNKTSRTFPHFISYYFEPPSRIERIEKIIRLQKHFNVRDVQILQLDNYSYYARELLFYALPILEKDSTNFNKPEHQALKELENWDYIFSPAYSAPAIWNAFYKHLLYNTFHKRMNERLFRTYTYISQFPATKILEIIKNNDSYWFDIPKTIKRETRESVVRLSFRQAVSELQKKFNNNYVKYWKMANQQKLKLNHLLSKSTFLKPAIDGGTYSVPGTYTSINKADWHPYSDYKVSVGSSARFITDMSDSTIFFSILGGNSGNPNSSNYKDQALFFINGGYLKYYLNPNLNEDNTLSLELYPD